MQIIQTIIQTVVVLFLLSWAPVHAGSYALDKFYEKTHTFRATFEQIVKDGDDESLQKSKGSLIISRPNKFVMIYSEPDEQQYISDGNILWIYDKDLEQVTIKKFDQEMKRSPVLVLSGNNELRELYNVDETVDYTKPEQDIFVLTPKVEPEEETATQFSRVELVFLHEKLQQLRMWDHFDHVTVLTLKDQVINEDVQDNTFQFVIPDSIDVLDNTK